MAPDLCDLITITGRTPAGELILTIPHGVEAEVLDLIDAAP
jgi:hypothetical protein